MDKTFKKCGKRLVWKSERKLSKNNIKQNY